MATASEIRVRILQLGRQVIEYRGHVGETVAMALTAVLTQTMLPKLGGGVVPAAELLMISYGARQHIRRNALQHLHQEITITRKHGSFTLEECLARLVLKDAISRADALVRAGHPEDFESALLGER